MTPLLLRFALCVLAASFVADGGTRTQPATLLAVIVNKNNPVGNIELAELRRLILGEVRQWSNNRRVTIVHRDASSAAYSVTLDRVARMTPAEYRRLKLNQEFRGEAPSTSKTLNSAKSACEFVFNVPGAIAVVEASFALQPPCLELAKVLSVDNKLPGEAHYSLQ